MFLSLHVFIDVLIRSPAQLQECLTNLLTYLLTYVFTYSLIVDVYASPGRRDNIINTFINIHEQVRVP